MINALLILTIIACGGGCRDRHDDDRDIADSHDTTSTSSGTSTAR